MFKKSSEKPFKLWDSDLDSDTKLVLAAIEFYSLHAPELITIDLLSKKTGLHDYSVMSQLVKLVNKKIITLDIKYLG